MMQPLIEKVEITSAQNGFVLDVYYSPSPLHVTNIVRTIHADFEEVLKALASLNNSPFYTTSTSRENM